MWINGNSLPSNQREYASALNALSTAAVTTAVRERLDRVRREQGESLADRLLAIGQDCAKRLKEPFRSADHDELLYDDLGPVLN